MNKVSEKTYQFPVQEKITILGSRIITSAQPCCKAESNKLILTDQWTVQLVYTNSSAKTPTQLLELPLAWEEVWPWEYAQLEIAEARYLKKPQIQKMQFFSTKQNPYVLQLAIQTSLKLDMREKQDVVQEAPLPAEDPVQNQPVAISEIILKLSQNLTAIEERIKLLEERQVIPAAKLNGSVVDSFRLNPIAKAIIEISASGNEDLLHKVATNGQGCFDMELPPGSYDIKIKHPRYQSLAVRSYNLAHGENKNQDFILKRI